MTYCLQQETRLETSRGAAYFATSGPFPVPSSRRWTKSARTGATSACAVSLGWRSLEWTQREAESLPREAYKKLPSGVIYADISVGGGGGGDGNGNDDGLVKEGSKVNVQWVLRRSNGYFVDSSAVSDSVPFIFQVGDPRGAIKGLDEGIRGMRAGGTRSEDGRLGRFKKGGFVMARQLDFPVLPVSISGASRILPRGCLFPRPGSIRITIHPPVDPKAFADDAEFIDGVRATIAGGLAPEER